MRPRSNWTPAIVSNREDRTRREAARRETRVGLVDVPASGPNFTALQDTYLNDGDGFSGDPSNGLDRTIQRRADVRFAIAVAVALTLPALIGIGVYIAMTRALGAN